MALDAHEIVLGLGGTVDYEVVWDPSRIEQLASREEIASRDLTDLAEIRSERELLISLLNFLSKGDGGERYVVDPAIIFNLSRDLPFRTTLGGTPVRAAMVMDIRGIPSTVHLVSTNQETRELLPTTTKIITSATEDTLYPHLIVQYPNGAEIRLPDATLRAHRANRLIYTHDPDNQELRLSPDLEESLRSAKIFLISGLNIFRDEESLTQRLEQLRDSMASLPEGSTVVFEDAGFHFQELSQYVRDALVPFLDVYSMNEDEAQAHLTRSIDLTSGTEVANLLTSLRENIPAKNLMLHTQRWAAIIGPDANNYQKALDAAVDMSGGRFCFGDGMTLDQLESMRDVPVYPDSQLLESQVRHVFSSNLAFTPGRMVEVDRPTTIGLGDSFIGGFIAQLAIDIG